MPYAYSTAALARPPVLFGRRLLPLTLGHVDVLGALGNPAAEGGALSVQELAAACWVCSLPWREASARLRAGRFSRQLGRMGARFARNPAAETGRAFAEYLAFYIAGPPRWDFGGDEEPRIPWHLALFCAIQRHTNLSMDEAWDLPVRRAAEICAGLSAISGDKGVMSAAEQAFEEEAGADDVDG